MVNYLITTLLFLQCSKLNVHTIAVAVGYKYDPPLAIHTRVSNPTGHYFASLSTVAPLPPVPALPSLPTTPPRRIQFPTVVQVQQPEAATRRLTASTVSGSPTYRSQQFQASIDRYREPRYEFPSRYSTAAQQNETQLFLPNGTTPKPPLIGFIYNRSSPSSTQSVSEGYVTASPPPRFIVAALAQAGPQPLRVPFGRQPVINSHIGPESNSYVVNGRQLKQYAVVEFVDNDLSQDTRPFVKQSFVNNYRAEVGPFGAGGISPRSTAMQIVTTTYGIVQGPSRNTSDATTLGSGGIGFIRFPDGTATLGSGSLNIVTNQQ